MAVNTTGSARPKTQSSPPGQQQQQKLAAMPAFGITSRLSAFGSGGDMYEKLYEKITSNIKKLNEEYKGDEKYTAIKMLKQQSGLNYSCIVVAETIGDTTSAHVIVVEKTGDYPDKIIENVNGTRYEIVRTPADAMDDTCIDRAVSLVAETLKVDANSVNITDGVVLPNEFDINSEHQVNDFLMNVFNSIHTENAIRVTGYNGINLNDIINENRNGKFTVSMYFNNDNSNMLDQTGMPIRQDVCISLSFKRNSNLNNRSIHQGNDSLDIVRTYGYIDFEYTGPIIINGMQSTQKFVPNFIITHMDSPFAPTPDIVALGVASVTTMNEDMNWIQAFRGHSHRKNETDYNDIGGLNIEGNIENSPTGFGKRYDTRSKTFDITELNKYIQTLVRVGNMLISMDIPKAGPETWFTSIFQYIKFRNDQGAIGRVNKALETVTNGAYNSNNIPMFFDVSNRIHGGFYRTKDGFKDIRHLSSYLAVANHVTDTNQPPILTNQYTNTFYNSNMSAEIRASERRKFIDDMSGNTAVYKQSYDRVTFSGPFLANLVGSLRAVGFAPVFSNAGAGNDMFIRRSTVDFNSAFLTSDVRLMGNTNVMYNNMYMQPAFYRTF